MKTLLEVVGRSVLEDESDVQMKGIDTILGNLTSGISKELPVKVDKSEWLIVTDGEIERIVRTFSFKDPRHVKDFVTHMIFEQDEMQHHARIIIEGNDVTVEAYTHDVNQVTELDKELADFCDKLYRDVLDFYIVDDREISI
jgi:pterin-4a-carbinolamine dehydratase